MDGINDSMDVSLSELRELVMDRAEYFGERCGEKSMKTQSMVNSDLSKIALAAIAAFVSAMTFTAIAVFITIL